MTADGPARRLSALLLVLGGSIGVAWAGVHGNDLGDYPKLFAPAMNFLLSGHLGAFYAHLPADGAGGSVILRAPAALLGRLLGHDQLAIYRSGAAACVLVAGCLGLRLARLLREAGQPAVLRAGTVAGLMLAPVALGATHYGHPEEVLGAALCVIAVLLAGAQRPAPAGAVLGLAVANKPWAALAVIPVVLALDHGRLRLLAAMAAIVGGWAASEYLIRPHAFMAALSGAATGAIAHPTQLWWPLSQFGTRTVVNPSWRLVLGSGPTTGFFPPGLLARDAHYLPVLVAVLLSVALRRREREVRTSLGLLALLFLFRCLLDPSNVVYYQIPFVIALAAWESCAGGPPVLALSATALLCVVFTRMTPGDAQYFAYLLVTVPFAAILARSLSGAQGRATTRSRPSFAPLRSPRLRRYCVGRHGTWGSTF